MGWGEIRQGWKVLAPASRVALGCAVVVLAVGLGGVDTGMIATGVGLGAFSCALDCARRITAVERRQGDLDFRTKDRARR